MHAAMATLTMALVMLERKISESEFLEHKWDDRWQSPYALKIPTNLIFTLTDVA